MFADPDGILTTSGLWGKAVAMGARDGVGHLTVTADGGPVVIVARSAPNREPSVP